jgi:hypothetical protein
MELDPDLTAPLVANPLARPAAPSDGTERLSAWDDYPIHQSAAPLSSVVPNQPGWAERFYFNLLRPTGEIAAILGGGVYPVRGVSEFYFCRFDGERQSNVRVWNELPAVGGAVSVGHGPFSLRCDAPLRDWSIAVDAGDARLRGRFAGALPPYLYSTLDVPSDEPGGEFDLYRHFIAVGRWELDVASGLDTSTEFIGVRDRTWGVRTRRIRLHNWYVFWLGDACLTMIHQELADGSVFFSEAGAVHADGRVERLRVADHDLRYHGHTREIESGRIELAGEDGPLFLEYERAGTAMRLAGAGYDASQGARETTSGVERDDYDLGDPEIARQTGRGTMDAGAHARVTGTWSAEGQGVVETAIARNHVKYGSQIF